MPTLIKSPDAFEGFYAQTGSKGGPYEINGTIYVWAHNSSRDIVEHTSTDGGATWSSEIIWDYINDPGGAERTKFVVNGTDMYFIIATAATRIAHRDLQAGTTTALAANSVVNAGLGSRVLDIAYRSGYVYVIATGEDEMVMGTNYARVALQRINVSTEVWTNYTYDSGFNFMGQNGAEGTFLGGFIENGPGDTLFITGSNSLDSLTHLGSWSTSDTLQTTVTFSTDAGGIAIVPAYDSTIPEIALGLTSTTNDSCYAYRTGNSAPTSQSHWTEETMLAARLNGGISCLVYDDNGTLHWVGCDLRAGVQELVHWDDGGTGTWGSGTTLDTSVTGDEYCGATLSPDGTEIRVAYSKNVDDLYYTTYSLVTEVTGDLASTEAIDTATINGDVLVSGSSAVTETQDTASFDGQVITKGDLAATEATDAASFSGQVITTGDLAATEASDTFAGAGGVLVSGSLSATEAQDTASFSGKFDISLADEELVFENETIVTGGVYISPDGTRMYTSDRATRTISQYDLRTPYKPDTAKFVASLTPFAGGHRFTISPDGLKLVVMDTSAKVLYQYSFGTAWDITSVGTTAGDIESQLNTLSGVASNFYISDDGLELYEQGYNGSFQQTLRHTSLSTPWDLSSNAGTEDEPFNGKLQGAWVSSDGTKLVVGTFSNTLQQYTLPTPWSIVGLTYDSLSLSINLLGLQQFVIQDQYVYASDGTVDSSTIAWYTGVSGAPYVPNPASFTATTEGTANDMVLGISRELVMDQAKANAPANDLTLSAVLDPAPTGLTVTRENSDVRIDWTSADGPFNLYRERRQGGFDNSTVSTTLTYPNNNGLGQNGLRNLSVRDPDDVSADQLVTHNEGNGVRVYVFDSGVRTSHNVFEGRTATGIDVYSGDTQNDPTIDSDPADGHGTPVASIIAGAGIGVAQEAIIVPIRCRSQNFGATSIADLTAAVDWIVANHPAGTLGVANFSIVGWETGSADGIEARVQMQRLIDEGIICCWAALNEGINDLSDRSILSWGSSGVIVCGGYNPSNELNLYNYGPDVDIYSASITAAAANTSDSAIIDAFSGTSGATPIISGICALVIAEGEATTPAEIKQLVLDRSTKDIVRGLDATSNNRAAYTLAWDTELEITQIAAQTYLDTTADVGKYRYWVRGETTTGVPTTEWSVFQEIDLVIRGGSAVAQGTANDAVLVTSVVGDLDATEATDSLAAAGDVLVTGTLAATETQDAAALTGEVLVSGDLAATESIDTAAFNGAAPTEGDLAATETQDTAALTGQVIVSGDLAVTEATDDAALAGDVLISGSFAVTEATDAAAIEGEVLISGDLAATEATDALAATGEVLVSGDLATTEAQDTAAFTGEAVIAGDLAVTEAADSFVANGDVLITGALSVTEASDAASFSGEVLVSGDLAVTETTDALAATGEVLVSGDLAVTEEQDIAVLSGASTNNGDLAATEQIDVANFVGEALAEIQGDLAVTEAQDTAALTGQVRVTGDLAVTEATDTASLSGQVLVTGDLAVTEQADALAATGEIPVQGDLAATEATDTASFAGTITTFGDLVATETADTIVVSGEVLVQGSLAATEQTDTASMSGASSVDGDLAATEATDTAAVDGDVLVSGDLAATEETDTALFSGGTLSQGTMVVTEPVDALAATGQVITEGDLAATEAFDEVLFIGEVPVSGQMAATEAGDGASVSGQIEVQGVLTAFEGVDVFRATSAVTGEGREYRVFTCGDYTLAIDVTPHDFVFNTATPQFSLSEDGSEFVLSVDASSFEDIRSDCF